MGGSVRLGRYLLDRRLALGGMAEVFLGRVPGPEGFQKRVVIKRILPMHAGDRQYVNLLISEARIAARLSHPNLIEVFGFEEIDGQYCLVMEYVDGHNLRALINQSARLTHPIPLPIAAWVIAEAAAGLYCAHKATDEHGVALNVVHRDISPENIIVTLQGRVKVLDFGIAKHNMSVTRTVTGAIMGKAPYMSPEQANGHKLDARSDIFSLGAVLYELVTLVSPFRRNTFLETLEAVKTGIAPLATQFRPDLPENLGQVLRQTLAKHSPDRFASADALAIALRQWVAEKTSIPSEDTRDFVSGVFSTTEVAAPMHHHWFDVDEVPLSGELEEPDVEIPEATYSIIRGESDPDVDARNEKTVQFGRPTSPEATSRIRITNASWTRLPALLGAWTRRQLRARTRAPLLLLAAALLAGVVGAIVVRRARGPEPRPAMPPPAAAAPRPAVASADLGQLRVNSTPEGALVLLDGKAQPELTPTVVEGITRGVVHEVRLERAGFQPVTQELEFTPADSSVITWVVTLTPVPATPAAVEPGPRSPGRPATGGRVRTGLLSLETEPQTEVSVDGRVLGTTPLREVKLAAGRHTLGLRTKEHGLVKTVEANVDPGEKWFKRVVLRKGQLAFDVRPWAVVYLCGTKLGATPLPPISAYEGSCSLRLINPELHVVREVPVTIRAGAVTKVVEQL